MSTLVVGVGSTNPVKLDAALDAFREFFAPGVGVRLESRDSSSGISSQPISDAETICGARNRAIDVWSASDSFDFGVGLEGGLHCESGLWFCTSWVVVIDQLKREHIGSGPRIRVPDAVLRLMDEDGYELGTAVDKVFNEVNSKQGDSIYGFLTNSRVTRRGVFRDSVRVALGSLLRDDLYKF